MLFAVVIPDKLVWTCTRDRRISVLKSTPSKCRHQPRFKVDQGRLHMPDSAPLPWMPCKFQGNAASGSSIEGFWKQLQPGPAVRLQWKKRHNFNPQKPTQFWTEHYVVCLLHAGTWHRVWAKMPRPSLGGFNCFPPRDKGPRQLRGRRDGTNL